MNSRLNYWVFVVMMAFGFVSFCILYVFAMGYLALFYMYEIKKISELNVGDLAQVIDFTCLIIATHMIFYVFVKGMAKFKEMYKFSQLLK